MVNITRVVMTVDRRGMTIAILMLAEHVMVRMILMSRVVTLAGTVGVLYRVFHGLVLFCLLVSFSMRYAVSLIRTALP
jgi:hypothetical protein